MNTKDPKFTPPLILRDISKSIIKPRLTKTSLKIGAGLIALRFNECINNQDIDGLSNLMTDDHIFIDRDGNTVKSKVAMIKNWIKFFDLFPKYKNTFTKAESRVV